MRRSICGAAGLAAIGLLTLAPSGAFAQKAESGLLGNKLWNTFDQVLRVQGQPTRIEVGAVAGGAQAAAPGGGMMSGGGAPGMPSMAGTSPYGGAPGGGAPAGSPYGGANMGQMMARMYGGGGGGGKMGGAMNPYGGGGGGLPGVGGMGIGGQDEGLSGAPGMGGGQRFAGGPAGGGAAATEEGEITWIYEKGTRTNIFLFNKDGRLIQISSFGYSGPAVTSRGVRLGDAIGKIYAKYQWTANITKDAARNTMSLNYSKDHHVAFQLADRGTGYRVIGITVGITELSQLQDLAPGVDFSGARGMGGTMGGGGPMGGMMPGGMMRGGGMRGRAGGGGGKAADAIN